MLINISWRGRSHWILIVLVFMFVDSLIYIYMYIDIYTYRSVPPTREILNVISDIPPTGIRSLPVVNSRRRFCNSLGSDNTTSQKFLQNHRQCNQGLIKLKLVFISLRVVYLDKICHHSVIILKARSTEQVLVSICQISLHPCVTQMFASAHSAKNYALWWSIL